jgi:hypothetical protein
MAKKTFEEQIVSSFQKTLIKDLKDPNSFINEELLDHVTGMALTLMEAKMKKPEFVKTLDAALDKALTEKELVKVVKLQVAKSLSGG